MYNVTSINHVVQVEEVRVNAGNVSCADSGRSISLLFLWDDLQKYVSLP